jgi:cell division topological specificity factor
MFENILNFFKKLGKNENKETNGSKNKAKERLHLVLMQDRANVSADFLELMKQEIIDVIKKYIEVEENEIDVRLTNEVKEDGTTGAPSLYANIPIVNIRNDMKKEVQEEKKKDDEKKAENSDNNEEEKKETKEDNEPNKSEEKQEILEEKNVQENDKSDDKGNDENNESDSKK